MIEGRRHGFLEAAAAVMVVTIGMLILAGALLAFSRTTRRDTETTPPGTQQERGSAGADFRIRVTFERDGETVSQEGFLENVHAVATVRSDGIFYSYVTGGAATRPEWINAPDTQDVPMDSGADGETDSGEAGNGEEENNGEAEA